MHVTDRSPVVTAGTVLRMGWSGRVPSAARRPVAPPARRACGVRAVAVVLASLALLLCGAVEVLPRAAASSAASPSSAAAAAQAAGTAASVPSRSPRARAVEAPATSLAVRAAGLTGVPAPTGPGGSLPPTEGPPVAPHLVADPQTRPPTSPLAASPAGTAGSRAPPGPAGT